MEQTLSRLRAQFPSLIFREGAVFCWSPETKEIIYNPKGDQHTASWSLFHEASHALLEHSTYATDFELLRLEIAAWEYAKGLADQLGVTVDENHIQDCLDSYRDWIYARSICTRCGTKSLQQHDLKHYYCFNCHEVWQVTPSRFCRAYRATKRATIPPLPHFDALLNI
jgi:hypothetical protein